MSQYPVLNETAHPAEFILSEASGQRSRDNALFQDPSVVKVGQPCKKTAEATTDSMAKYVVAAAGADCQALAIYGGASSSGNDLKIAVLTRDCEVNGRLIDWGGLSAAEQVAGVAALAAKGIIVRI